MLIKRAWVTGYQLSGKQKQQRAVAILLSYERPRQQFSHLNNPGLIYWMDQKSEPTVFALCI